MHKIDYPLPPRQFLAYLHSFGGRSITKAHRASTAVSRYGLTYAEAYTLFYHQHLATVGDVPFNSPTTPVFLERLVDNREYARLDDVLTSALHTCEDIDFVRRSYPGGIIRYTTQGASHRLLRSTAWGVSTLALNPWSVLGSGIEDTNILSTCQHVIERDTKNRRKRNARD